MNYTEKYHLPQWEETDRIMRTDFNRMCADMEAGLAGNKAAADAGIAQAKAAATEAARLPYVIGSYTGTGNDLTIHLGFRPSFLIIAGMGEEEQTQTLTHFHSFSAITRGDNYPHRLALTDTGFTVLGYAHGSYIYPLLFESGRTYCYIAFR